MESGKQYPYFIEEIEGDSHEGHVEDIRGGGKYCCQYGHYQDGVAPVPLKKGRFHEACARNHHHYERQLEYQAKAQQKEAREIDELSNGDNGPYCIWTELQEKIDAEWECYEKTKQYSQHEQEYRGEEEGGGKEDREAKYGAHGLADPEGHPGWKYENCSDAGYLDERDHGFEYPIERKILAQIGLHQAQDVRGVEKWDDSKGREPQYGLQ